MIVIPCEQGSPEWMVARLGIPTASQFDRLLTPKTRKPSTSQAKYRNELIAEWLLGHPLEWGTSGWMDRGTALEEEARRWYAFERDVEVERPGFILRDDRRVGGSPDGLVGDRGGVETKCPAAHTHVGYLLDDGPDYIGQVQGYMYITDREWWDVVSYCPGLPPYLGRVERDEEYIEALVAALGPFNAALEVAKDRLRAHKVQVPEPTPIPPPTPDNWSLMEQKYVTPTPESREDA